MSEMKEIGYVGSRLNPQPSHIARFISHLQNTCEAKCRERPLDWAAAHNVIAIYTLGLLTFASGHRAVADPFPDLNSIDQTLGIAILEDKVVGKGHEGRLVWLPNMAIQQLQNYLDHLRSLATHLQQININLSTQIWSITESDYVHPMPMFFLLKENLASWESIRPANLAHFHGDVWGLPENTNRHLLSSWLRANGCPGELSDAQLGHVEIGCQPFGTYSSLNPVEIAKILHPLLEDYLSEQGWKPITGIPKPRGGFRKQPPLHSKYLKSTIDFGSLKRAKSRSAHWIQDGQAVRKLWEDEFPEGLPSIVDDETVDVLQQRLVSQARKENGRVLVRLVLFRRIILGIRRQGKSIKIPGRLAISNPEPSPFTCKTVLESYRFETARTSFFKYLSQREGKKAELERRLAEILLCSILISGHTDKRFQNNVASAVMKGVHAISNNAYVDVPLFFDESSSPIKRWFLDPIACALIIGLHKNLGTTETGFDHPMLVTYIEQILVDIGFPNSARKSKSTNTASIVASLTQLTNHGKAYWVLRLPGVLHSYSEGEHLCSSLPAHYWVRLATGKSQKIPAEKKELISTETFDLEVPFNGGAFTPESPNWNNAKSFWKKITQLIGENDPSSSKRNSQTKQELERKLVALARSESENLPPIANLLLAWLIHLCQNGTQHKQNLRTNTIVTYARTIGLVLIEQAYDQDILRLPDIGLEDIYRRALDQSTRSSADYTLKRFKEFHSYLVFKFALPKIDWSEVVGEGSLEAEIVDAGVIRLDDYLLALDLVLSDSRYDERLRLAHGIVLFFAYRFGLRAGEVFRLTASDVLMCEDDVVIYVRNNIYGETKSDNGIRQIPLIGSVSKDELSLLKKWLLHIETYASGDHLTALLSAKQESRLILDRSTCILHVVEALRKATNLPDVRLRHLRHTFATKLFLGMVFCERPSGLAGHCYRELWGDISPSALRTTLLERPEITRRAMYGMSVALGHGSPAVSLNNYIHTADITLFNWISRQKLAVPDKALAYIYQTSHSNIRKIRSRMAHSKAQLDPILVSHFFPRLKAIDIEFETPSEQRDFIAVTPSHDDHSNMDPSDVDLLLSVAGLRNTMEGLADRFLVNETEVLSILQKASALQGQTGFTDFGLPDLESDRSWGSTIYRRNSNLEKEANRARNFLRKLKADRLADSGTQTILETWPRCFFPTATELLVPNRKDLTDLLQALQYIGIPNKDLEIVVPDIPDKRNEGDDPKASFLLDLVGQAENFSVELGLGFRINKRLPKRLDKLQPWNRVGLVMRSSQTHKLGYQHTLNRVLFILCCWHLFRAEKALGSKELP